MDTSLMKKKAEKDECYSKQISKVIHDLNNIIGPISGYADMIYNDNCGTDKPQQVPKLEQRIEKIRLCTRKAVTVIEKLDKLKREIEGNKI